MPRRAGNSAKAERDQLRERMRALGCSVPQIAVEMARRFGLRPRLAWRHALGWPQWKLAQQYNTAHAGVKLSDHRVSEYEVWPPGGSPPSLRYLARLAATYGHGCTPSRLVDADDLRHLTPADRCLLTASPTAHTSTAPITPSRARRGDTQLPALIAGQPATGLVVADVSEWAAAMGLQLPDTLTMQLMTCLESLAQPARGALGTARERDPRVPSACPVTPELGAQHGPSQGAAGTGLGHRRGLPGSSYRRRRLPTRRLGAQHIKPSGRASPYVPGCSQH